MLHETPSPPVHPATSRARKHRKEKRVKENCVPFAVMLPRQMLDDMTRAAKALGLPGRRALLEHLWRTDPRLFAPAAAQLDLLEDT